MLPWEVSVLLSVGDEHERRLGFGYMLGTGLGDHGIIVADRIPDSTDLDEFINARGPAWQTSSEWRAIIEECERRGLPLDGSIPRREETT